MGQLSIASSPNPSQQNAKKAAVVVAVLVGHVGVLLALAMMKPIELPPIEPQKPLKVKFVKIREQKQPEPPKPKEKPKPEKPKPKPPVPQKVKIVEQPKPKPVQAPPKIQQVKRVEPRPAPPPVEVATPQASVTVQTTTQTVATKTGPVNVDAPPSKNPPTSAPSAPTTTSNPAPRQVSEGEINWKSRPRPSIQKTDLAKASSAKVVVRINADGRGRITNVRIVQSSGNTKIDNEVMRAVRRSSFNPYIVGGVGVPIYADLPIHIQ